MKLIHALEITAAVLIPFCIGYMLFLMYYFV